MNCFGGFGQQGYGYNVELLYNEIGNILGLNNSFHAIILGAGNMGQALANYDNFEKRGFRITAIFDVEPELVGRMINDISVQHIDELEEFVRANRVDIGILCVPYEQTPLLAEKLARLGVKGLWNFTPMDLKLPYNVVIENVHLSDSLMVLGYRINERFDSFE